MILHVKFIRLEGKFPQALGPKEGRKYLEVYCYDHTKVVDLADNGREFVAILRTEADTDERADYLANYQAGRFRSCLFATEVFDNPTQIAEKYGSFEL